jgi:hypothetical protein
VQDSLIDYKKRFFDMPLDLQELSPKPDFDDTGDFAQKRIPKLAVRGRTDVSTPIAQSTPAVEASLNEKESRSSDENTLAPSSPVTAPNSIAPWEKESKLEPRPSTNHSESFTTSTNERHSSDVSKQPFRHEVSIESRLYLTLG